MFMITVHAKNFTITDDEKETIEAKTEKLIHLAKDMTDESTKIHVEFELLAKNKHLVQGTITISLPHHDTLRAEYSSEGNVVSIMDELEKKIRPQIEKHKSTHQ